MGGETAEHGDIAIAGNQVAIVWKEFDGRRATLRSLRSSDRGATFSEREIGDTGDASDQPRLLVHKERFYVFWNTRSEPLRVIPVAMTSTRFARVLLALMLTAVMSAAVAADMRAFDADSMQAIRTAHGGRPFILAFWSVHCAPCLGDMADWRELRRRHPRGADPSRGDGSAFGTCTRGSGARQSSTGQRRNLGIR